MKLKSKTPSTHSCEVSQRGWLLLGFKVCLTHLVVRLRDFSCVIVNITPSCSLKVLSFKTPWPPFKYHKRKTETIMGWTWFLSGFRPLRIWFVSIFLQILFIQEVKLLLLWWLPTFFTFFTEQNKIEKKEERTRSRVRRHYHPSVDVSLPSPTVRQGVLGLFPFKTRDHSFRPQGSRTSFKGKKGGGRQEGGKPGFMFVRKSFTDLLLLQSKDLSPVLSHRSPSIFNNTSSVFLLSSCL